jgi:two-component system cell cycle response regulator DivK
MARRPPKSGLRPKGPIVLLVEDLEGLRVRFAGILVADGCVVLEAADGRAAVEKAISLRPEVILMDLSLPVMDGIEAMRVLKTHEHTAHIPVIALSGLGKSEADLRAMGFDVVLQKPCSPDELVGTVRAVVELTRGGYAG